MIRTEQSSCRKMTVSSVLNFSHLKISYIESCQLLYILSLQYQKTFFSCSACEYGNDKIQLLQWKNITGIVSILKHIPCDGEITGNSDSIEKGSFFRISRFKLSIHMLRYIVTTFDLLKHAN